MVRSGLMCFRLPPPGLEKGIVHKGGYFWASHGVCHGLSLGITHVWPRLSLESLRHSQTDWMKISGFCSTDLKIWMNDDFKIYLKILSHNHSMESFYKNSPKIWRSEPIPSPGLQFPWPFLLCCMSRQDPEVTSADILTQRLMGPTQVLIQSGLHE
jgi:hypothetical protein